LYAVDEKTGKLSELLKETDAAWINLVTSCPKWLKDGSAFLWMTERTGEWSLELRARDGKLTRTLTPKGFGLLDLAGVDDERKLVYLAASTDPTQMQVFSIPLGGGEPKKLTSEAGNHAFSFGRKAGVYVHSYSLVDGKAGTNVCRVGGE